MHFKIRKAFNNMAVWSLKRLPNRTTTTSRLWTQRNYGVWQSSILGLFFFVFALWIYSNTLHLISNTTSNCGQFSCPFLKIKMGKLPQTNVRFFWRLAYGILNILIFKRTTWLIKFLREKRRWKININSNQTLISWNWAVLAKNVFHIKIIRRNVHIKIYTQTRKSAFIFNINWLYLRRIAWICFIYLGMFIFVTIFSYLHFFMGKRGLFVLPQIVRHCCHFFRIFSSSWGNVGFLFYLRSFVIVAIFSWGKRGLFLPFYYICVYYFFGKVL